MHVQSRSFNTITFLIFLSLNCLGQTISIRPLESGESPNTPRTWNPVMCENTAEDSIDVCIHKAIQSKTEPLTINIEPGIYILAKPLLFYNVSNIYIKGSDTTNPPTINVPDRFKDSNQKTVAQHFTFLLIDSSNISFSNLSINGREVKNQRGFAVCGITKNISQIKLQKLRAIGFDNYFSIFGQALQRHHMDKMAQDSELPEALRNLLKPEADASCSKGISNVEFSDNNLELKSVGFYFAPNTAEITGEKSAANWSALSNSVALLHQNIRILRNTFKIANDYNEPVDSRGEITSDMEFHSFMKLHYAKNVLISENTFNAGDTEELFNSGGMINLAAGLNSVQITDNKFKFSPHSHAANHAINIQSAFNIHPLFGIGIQRLFPPVTAVTVTGNIFLPQSQKKGIRIVDCCINEKALMLNRSCSFPPTSANPQNTIPLCNGLDSAQEDGIRIYENANGGISYQSKDEKDWVNGRNRCYKDMIVCRKHVDVQ